MDRRGALGSLASLWLAACGGGGGGGGEMTAAPAAPVPAPPLAVAPPTASGSSAAGSPVQHLDPAFTGPVVLWGDSMVPPVVRALAPLYGEREVHDGGFPGETSGMVLAHQRDDMQYRNATTLFWYGHNNIRIDLSGAAAQVKADLAASVALLAPGNERYLILAVINDGVQGLRGTPRYDVVTQLDRDLAAQYGSRFLDIRSFMVAQSSAGNPQGAADLQADVPSSSLRFDEIHLTGYGADIVARHLKSVLDARGW